MGQAQSNGPASAHFQHDRRITSQPELRSTSSANKVLSNNQRVVSDNPTNTNSRRGLIGPMRSRVKGKFPPIASRSQRLIDPFEQPQPRFSPRSDAPVKDAGISAYPEWTTTLTSVPTNSPSVRQSAEERQSPPRSNTLPTRFDTGHAARSAHVDSIFGAGGRQSIESDQGMSNLNRATVNDNRSSPPSRQTPPGSSASPSPNPSPRPEYRVSAQPSHPSITELPETEGADANSIMDSRRSSAETIRTASNAATANPGGRDENDRREYLHPLRASDDDGIQQHGKRLSDMTTASYEASSIAPSTASGLARKAADKSNQQTLLAYWQASDSRNQASTSASGHLSPPAFQQSPHRHSWASSRSGARSPGEPRNLSPYRQVAGRWTSHWEDRRGLGISDSSDTLDAQLPLNVQDASPVAENELNLVRASKPSSELEVNTRIQDAGWQEEKDVESERRPGTSPTRPNRKPVPDHDFGPSPTTPTRTQARLSEPFSISETDGNTSKRTSDQSHLSSTTGALHQHVEKLRAGPTFQIDEDASHLLNPKQRILETDEPPATPKGHGTAAAVSFDPPSSATSSPQQKRGRALSLSLMARLKNRTRKSSDASVLSIRSPSFNRIDPPSPAVSTPQTPLSPVVQLRRESDLTYESTSVAKQPSTQGHTRQPSSPARLYQMARRPSRKAAPTTASSDTNVISSSMPRSSSQVNVTKYNKDAALITTKAPSMQRKYSSNTATARHSRPASIASRRSSRSKRSSNTSLRTAAASHAVSSTRAQGTSSPMAASASTAIASSGSGPWWNPWSRKNSVTGLLGNNEKAKNEISEEEQGWVDDPMEDDRGIVSPVAEDFSSMNIAGPEKVQQPWTPAWSNRVTHARRMSETSQSSVEQKGTQDVHPIAQTSSRESPPLAFIGPNAPVSMTSSSSFSSLAPIPAPAPVPPPRKHRRGSRKTDSSSQNASSSSTNSPGMHGNEVGTMARNMSKNDRSDSLDGDEEFYSPMEQNRDLDFVNNRRDSSQTDTIRGPKVYSAGVVDLSQAGVSNTDTRESLLSDDLDYAPTVHDKQEASSRADDLDNAVTSQFYRSSIIDPRRARGNNYANLSPVREIMTPESRIASDDRSGARSAASTFDALSHHRVNSGASMGMIAIPTHATTDYRAGTSTPERRPLPAPSVVAEPRADMSSVHRTNSISSSFATSAAGGQTSIGSMQKHAGEGGMPNAATAIARRSTSTKATATSPPEDSRLRASSMPSKSRSPLAQSSSPPPMERHTISRSVGARLSQQSIAATARESWMSSDGPWDGKVVDVSTVVALPAAKGGAKPVQGIVRRQRSRSTPFALQDVLNDDIQREERMLEENAPPEAVPFAETAVQASLAALQALEKSEQAQAGDWRARWASEKLLGYSNGSYLSVPPERRQRSGDQSLQVPNADDLSDYSGARTRRRAEPYPRSHALEGSASSIDGGRSGSATAAAARRKARSKRQELNSSAGGYESSIIGGAFTSDSESRPTRSRSRRKKRSKSASSKAPAPRSTKLDSYPTTTASPSQQKRTLTAAEYDEIVVPAHAKRIEREDAEEARMTMEQQQALGAMPTGMVAAGSPSPITPTFPQGSMSPSKIGDASLMTIIDHDESKNDSTYLRRREATETTNASDKRLPGRTGMEKSTTSRRQRSASGISTGKRHGSGHVVREERERDHDRESRRHGKQTTNSSSHSIARSTKSSSRKGYGCDDIVAWQASLRMAALPSVSES
ncbi:uncharacterized protein FA14DRAFT_178827 [Meira miltonrushii]|uniref:Uncharacterized protein n=1 Tax=Meira miltonrushii TaxID=1280837 RepID=A0A316VD37_9BASI|nr:uncharacterized protein FA14DRAFT_178827 [Meira miltonrushii]PWN35456.1 hypothetical protein FA14DRAFT_178827 [Meira miltonrushii]